MTVLAAQPEDLRSAARTLVLAEGQLEELVGRLARSETATAVSWEGIAALGHRAATERVRAAVLARCGPLGALARSVDALAGQAEQAQDVVRAAQRARDDAQAERRRHLARLGTVVDPAEAEAVRERVAWLDTVVRHAQDEINGAEDALEQARGVVDRTLQDSWLGVGWDDLLDLVRAGKGLAPVWRGGGLVVVGTRLLLASAALARDLSPWARQLVEARVHRLLKVVIKTPLSALLAGSLGRVMVPIFVVSDAWPDLMDGGGYAGWRGLTVRVTAGLAIPGSVAMVTPHPVAAGIGAVTVGAYYLVKGGNLIYDNRQTLARAGQLLWRHRDQIRELTKRLVTPHPALPLGPLGPALPIGRSRGELPDLPGLDDLRRFLPGIGGPLHWPDVPIGPGPRLPVIPPLTLSGLAPIVLPHLRKLF